MLKNASERHLEIKRASFLELFFDLIFVYAIQKIAHVLLHTHNGTISSELFFKYVVMSLFLWIIWSHQTFYTNRFGEITAKDIGFIIFNIFVLVFLSNSLFPDFEKTFFPFFICVGILYLSISLQYFMHLKHCLSHADKRTCQSFAIVAFIVSMLSFIALIIPANTMHSHVVHYIPAFLGIFIAGTGLIPFRKYFAQSPVNMMHLVERFSLLTIIIFGEVLVGLASTFSITHFNFIYIFQFIILITLFGIYWLFTETFINDKRKTIGFRLVYSHLIINIALGLLNSAIIFSNNNELKPMFEISIMYTSILLFLIGLWLNMPHYHDKYKSRKFVLLPIVILVITFIISMIFKETIQVMVVLVALSNTLILYLYYKYK
ncbi:low temperature requirement protein A [Staphylococcus caeli]|uniref:Low temperature requirement protein A n=1 Tax=Staphylococcus caeli TaxID=2201815 RepID=A0A1D4L359_9STAP|nr:low temperature requirement protein A [Staphylococcus caeli]SCS80725.1 Low temperature requirement protein A [Staphylococcus caeli]SCS99768.1 Low temperature requirement protein A [Staphylococcus caeli]